MLRALHPPLSSTAQLPPMPSDTEPIQLEDDSTLRRILRSSNNGATGGPSGWAGNMLSVLVDSVSCRIGLIRLLQDIINGNIPDTVRPHLLTCKLVAINKPGIKTGVRPIAMGEIFYRVSAILATHRVRDIAANLLLPHQYGVGVPGGCERIVHSLQHCLTDRSHRVCALKIDITNAFNTVDRVQLLNKLYASPQLSPIWRLVQFAYATDSPLLLQRCENVSLSSSNGVRQGDLLSGLLFCYSCRRHWPRLLKKPQFNLMPIWMICTSWELPNKSCMRWNCFRTSSTPLPNNQYKKITVNILP